MLLAAGWAVFAVIIGDSWWQLAVAVFLAVMLPQALFLSHDAGHQQIFRSRRGNHIIGVLAATWASG